jgi:hypothetical protein
MFNEQLEKLIEMALIDGVLTDKEREILKRKAVSQGFDEDEFEMVLEAKLFEKNQTTSQVINNNDSNLSGIHLLFKKINDIDSEQEPNIEVKKEEYKNTEDVNSFFSNVGTFFSNSSSESDVRKQKNKWVIKQKEKILNIINTFPIGNIKDEILEFLTYSVPLSIKGGKAPSSGLLGKAMPQFALMESFEKYENEKEESEIINENRLYDYTDNFSQKNYSILLRHNWKLKSEQVVLKGRSIFAVDSEGKKQIEEFAKQLGMKTEGGGFFGLFK